MKRFTRTFFLSKEITSKRQHTEDQHVRQQWDGRQAWVVTTGDSLIVCRGSLRGAYISTRHDITWHYEHGVYITYWHDVTWHGMTWHDIDIPATCSSTKGSKWSCESCALCLRLMPLFTPPLNCAKTVACTWENEWWLERDWGSEWSYHGGIK